MMSTKITAAPPINPVMVRGDMGYVRIMREFRGQPRQSKANRSTSRRIPECVQESERYVRGRRELLSTPFHKYNHVCGEGFLAQKRRERRAYPSGVCKERATTSGPKSTAARRAALLFGSGFVAPRSQPHFGG